MKFKIIRREGKIFLIRLSFGIKSGSIKVHLILNDDVEDPHKHPWNFTSFLISGYKEIVDGHLYRHPPFSVIKRTCTQHHQVKLYRLFGLKIPCLTIGKYSKKIHQWCERKTLCDGCKPVGYCIDKKMWEDSNTIEK